MQSNLWKDLVAEFFGTFTLVTIGCGAVLLGAANGGNNLASSLVFGLALIVAIYAWGAHSGGHFNPAVSLGAAVAGEMDWMRMIAYWIVQIVAGIAAAAVLVGFFGTGSGVGASSGEFTTSNKLKAVLLEALLTFFLVLAFLFTTRGSSASIVAGFVIGLTLAAAMFVGLPWTGGSMNPARSFGPAIFAGQLNTVWIYLLGPLIGALIAALLYRAYSTTWCMDKRLQNLDTKTASRVVSDKVTTTFHRIGNSVASAMPTSFAPR